MRLLVGHLEEEEEGDLLRISQIREPVVPEQVRVAPGLVDYLLRVVVHECKIQSFTVSCAPFGSLGARAADVLPELAVLTDRCCNIL